ncbi:hypothetical protein L204_105905 [Cryptococcus depauperatus]|nr:hypothetical protein L204_05030 [Cryptococcus depauperatus CBS 7855]
MSDLSSNLPPSATSLDPDSSASPTNNTSHYVFRVGDYNLTIPSVNGKREDGVKIFKLSELPPDQRDTANSDYNDLNDCREASQQHLVKIVESLGRLETRATLSGAEDAVTREQQDFCKKSRRRIEPLERQLYSRYISKADSLVPTSLDFRSHLDSGYSRGLLVYPRDSDALDFIEKAQGEANKLYTAQLKERAATLRIIEAVEGAVRARLKDPGE